MGRKSIIENKEYTKYLLKIINFNNDNKLTKTIISSYELKNFFPEITRNKIKQLCNDPYEFVIEDEKTLSSKKNAYFYEYSVDYKAILFYFFEDILLRIVIPITSLPEKKRKSLNFFMETFINNFEEKLIKYLTTINNENTLKDILETFKEYLIFDYINDYSLKKFT